MTERKFDLVPLGPFECALCGKKPDGECGRCKALVCKKCWKQHKKSHEQHAVDQMHQDTCITCRENHSSERCAYCPAPLCTSWMCREEHEKKHFNTRSDDEKNGVHKKYTANPAGKHDAKKAPLTIASCVGCGKPATGTCSSQNPSCSAPLCDQCYKAHEEKHLDTRSDEEKDEDRIKAIIEEIDRDP